TGTTTDGGATSDGGIAGDTTPTGAPTWSTQFVAADASLFTTQDTATSQITFGLASANAVDQLAGQLVFPGSTTFGPTDHAGTDFATEIDAKATNFQYGQYRSRVRLAACASTEDVVNGNFTYFNDGTDHDGDGLIDNSEIDIEILCGTPSVLSLTIWSEYTDDNGNFRKWTRAVDLATGSYQESTADNIYDLGPSVSDPDFLYPGFFDPNAFYEMGFEWHADSIRYFIVLNNKEVTLWNFTNQALIPKLPTQWLFNVWHPATHWFGNGGAANYPANDATMQIDWARYWATTS
ncbi:MAG TPA: glycoside hydrolase family 16 protein, partial [Polyangia bacterium]|nr:glycoside hydrolase family 16 protein [Polyangia bacterium]